MEALNLFDLPAPAKPPKKVAAPVESLTIEGTEIRSESPEGKERKAELAELFRHLEEGRPSAFGVVLPDGVKALMSVPGGVIAIHQTPPRVYSFKWIAANSGKPYGPGTKYREVRIALPYVIVFAVFERTRRGKVELSGRNECFFLNQPLDVEGMKTELRYPALLNCSKMPDGRKSPIAWICSQHIDQAELTGAPDVEAAIQRGLRTLLRHLFESGFNRSSEHHEVSSWYAESVKAEIDPRIATVEAWEQATAEDPLFVLEVPWLPTGKTVREVAETIARATKLRGRRVQTSNDLVRLLFGRKKPADPAKKEAKS